MKAPCRSMLPVTQSGCFVTSSLGPWLPKHSNRINSCSNGVHRATNSSCFRWCYVMPRHQPRLLQLPDGLAWRERPMYLGTWYSYRARAVWLADHVIWFGVTEWSLELDRARDDALVMEVRCLYRHGTRIIPQSVVSCYSGLEQPIVELCDVSFF